MNYLAIDPHSDKLHAVAFFVNGRCEDIQDFDFDDLYDYVYNSGLVSAIAVEDQYMYKNVRTLKTLVLAVGEIKGIAKMCDVGFYLINPASWQKMINFPGTKLSKAEKDKMYIRNANKYCKVDNADHAVAVLIGVYFGFNLDMYIKDMVK
jgi:hypothetical protein